MRTSGYATTHTMSRNHSPKYNAAGVYFGAPVSYIHSQPTQKARMNQNKNHHLAIETPKRHDNATFPHSSIFSR